MLRNAWRFGRPSRADAGGAKLSADNKGAIAAAVPLMLIGWGGLAHLVTTTTPRIGGELWLFFLLLQLAVTGSAIPIWRFLSLRFVPVNQAPPSAGVVARRSIWTGILVVACAWLLIPRALSLPLLLILLLFFVVVEVVLRHRETAHD